MGYALGSTIYINEALKQDYERTNKHELLHFFEETEEQAEEFIQNALIPEETRDGGEEDEL